MSDILHDFNKLLTLNVLVNVTIGMGDDIQSSKAFALDVFCGLTSIFMFCKFVLLKRRYVFCFKRFSCLSCIEPFHIFRER